MQFTKWIKNRFKIILFIAVTTQILFTAIFENTRTPAGDGVEYVLMSEGIVNHGTPDIRIEDVDSYIEQANMYNAWSSNPKYHNINSLRKFLKLDSSSFLDGACGVIIAKSGKTQSIHFSTYSYFVSIFKMIFHPLKLHPVDYFFIANGVMILLVIFAVLFYLPIPNWFSILFSALFYYSAVQWYLVWTHPEVFVACLTVLGLFSFEFKNKFLGVLLCSVAATQYQPLSLLVLILVGFGVFSSNFSIKTIFYFGITSSLVLLPSVFYYYHFSITNLVKELGFLDVEYVGFDRLFSFFFDLNQGMILSAPILLFLYFTLYGKNLYERFKKVGGGVYFWDFVPVLIVVLVCIVSTMGNWNHGQSVSNRYVVYIGTILICHFGWLILNTKIKNNKLIYGVLLITQIFSVIHLGGLAPSYWTETYHKRGALFMLDVSPAMYNPDPYIFACRTEGEKSIPKFHEGVVHCNPSGKFRKMMINKKHLKNVAIGGLSYEEVLRLVENRSDQYGWVYIHESDLFDVFKEERAKEILNNLNKKS